MGTSIANLKGKLKRKGKTFMRFLLFTILLIGFGIGFIIEKGSDTPFLMLIFIGLGASFLGTLAGGAGLITVPSMVLTGIPIQTSIATNKFSSGVAAFSSVFYLIRSKQLTIKLIAIYLLVAFFGGINGALVTSHIQEKTMNLAAFFLLCFALLITLKNKEWTEHILVEHKTAKKIKFYIPFLIAAYDGGFGPGSSTFSILYYMKKSHTYMKAVQMTRVLILGSCTGGFLVFYQTGFIQWSYAIAMSIGSIIGSQIGLMLLPKVPKKVAKTLIIMIICLLMIQMIYKFI